MNLPAPRKTPSLVGTRRDAVNDEAVLRSMKAILSDKLRDAVMACYVEARSLQGLDADEVMKSVNEYFAPTGGYQSDNFDDCFHAFSAKLEEVTGHWPTMKVEAAE